MQLFYFIFEINVVGRVRRRMWLEIHLEILLHFSLFARTPNSFSRALTPAEAPLSRLPMPDEPEAAEPAGEAGLSKNEQKPRAQRVVSLFLPS